MKIMDGREIQYCNKCLMPNSRPRILLMKTALAMLVLMQTKKTLQIGIRDYQSLMKFWMSIDHMMDLGIVLFLGVAEKIVLQLRIK